MPTAKKATKKPLTEHQIRAKRLNMGDKAPKKKVAKKKAVKKKAQTKVDVLRQIKSHKDRQKLKKHKKTMGKFGGYA